MKVFFFVLCLYLNTSRVVHRCLCRLVKWARKKRTPSMMTMKSASTPNKYIGKKAERKNDPKNSAKKTRDFFVLVHLGFCFYKWINEVWSMFLFFFSLFFLSTKRMCAGPMICSLHTTVFFFSCFLVLFYVWRKEQAILLHKTYIIYSSCFFFTLRYH